MLHDNIGSRVDTHVAKAGSEAAWWSHWRLRKAAYCLRAVERYDLRDLGSKVGGITMSSSESTVTREEFEAALMRQEHRLFRILWHFWNRKQYSKNDVRYQAVAEALVYRIAIALAPTATAGGAGLIAVIGL